jgi:hypothetical protein
MPAHATVLLICSFICRHVTNASSTLHKQHQTIFYNYMRSERNLTGHRTAPSTTSHFQQSTAVNSELECCLLNTFRTYWLICLIFVSTVVNQENCMHARLFSPPRICILSLADVSNLNICLHSKYHSQFKQSSCVIQVPLILVLSFRH